MEDVSAIKNIEVNFIKDFQIIRPLGRGGYSDVFHVKSLETNEEFALKVIKKNKSRHISRRVNNEISIQSSLNHTNIAKLHTSFEDFSYIYLAIEYCSGGELHSYIKQKGRLSENETAKICKQVIEGIDDFHSLGILHRDLKVGNLLLSKDKTIVKIGDFGLAIELKNYDEIGETICGTPNYLSPYFLFSEVITRKSYGFASDIWALGCIIYTCLVGKPPFDCPEVQQTLAKAKTLDYSFPDYLSQNAKDLISKILCFDPERRLTTKQIVSHPFFKHPRIPKLQIKTNYENKDYNGLFQTPCTKTNRSNVKTEPIKGSKTSRAPSSRATQSSDQENIQDKFNQVRRSLQLDGIPALNTHNLEPFKHTLKNGYIEVTQQNNIKIQIGKRFLEVSSDGMVIFYQGKRFTLKAMPSSAQKLYKYATLCLSAIRSKTVNVSQEDSEAKYALMSNFPNPNFEIEFLDGPKFIYKFGDQFATLCKPTHNKEIPLDTQGKYNVLIRKLLEKLNVCFSLVL